MHKITDNLAQVLNSVHAAIRASHRSESEVTVVAVGKKQPAQALEAAYGAGQRHFGESYVQEALDKMSRMHHPDIVWHFIGPIQSNKTRAIARHFDWVHSVDRYKVAERLGQQRPDHLPPLNICLQINIDAEAAKSGAAPEEALALATDVARLPGLKLRGLMAIPDPEGDPRSAFRRLRALAHQMERATHVKLDTLSMGMSGDFQEAIAEGATIVRIGTGIFGSREA